MQHLPGERGSRGRWSPWGKRLCDRGESVGIHSGHRERMKEQILGKRRRWFNDHQLLELFLFYCIIPQGDVNPLAHELLNRFGIAVRRF